MVISMEKYRRARASNNAVAPRADDELMCVNWNPAVVGVALSSFRTPSELSPDLPPDHAPVDREFLDRARALATQI